VILLDQAGVRDDELPVVEDEVRDELATEPLDLGTELLRLLGQLRERLGEPVTGLHPLALQRADELRLVVPRHRQGMPRAHHPHRQSQHARSVRPAVDEVAEEDRAAALGVRGVDRATLHIALDHVAELREQRLELAPAPVDITDRVEGTALLTAVVEQRLTDERRLRDRLHPGEHVDLPEALLAEVPHRPAQLVLLTLDDGRAERAVLADLVALDADALRDVEHHGDGEDVVVARQIDQRLARGRLDVGRVDDRQEPGVQAACGDIAECCEGVGAGGLVVLVVGDEPTEEVTRQGLEPTEMRGGEGRLAGPAHADEDHKRQFGYRQCGGGLLEVAHEMAFRKMASCVGEPSCGSTSPTVRCSTP
jgi:hypothetical protein